VVLHASFDDIVSAGWLGAIDAVDRFDPARHVELRSYAKWRIQGAIGDYLRGLDPLTRDHRKEIQREGGEAPLTLSIDQPAGLHSHHDSHYLDSLHESIADPRADHERDLIERDTQQHSRRTLTLIFSRARLRPRNAAMLRRYIAGEKLKAIGESVGVKESRASQICADALRKLRAAA
jgi:RNA polymerase sigma factor (sigma-70 family)